EEAMAYSRGAVERAMKVQEVILRAIDGKLTWVQAADILGYSPRTIRHIRWRLQHYGYDGLLDRRRQTPSPKRCQRYCNIPHLRELKFPHPPQEEGVEMSTEMETAAATIGAEVTLCEEVPMVRRERWEEIRRLWVTE